jgi:hypothetical protein
LSIKIKRNHNIYKDVVEAAFSSSEIEESGVEMCPVVPWGTPLSLKKGNGGCAHLFLNKTEETERMEPLCFSEKDLYGHTVDGRVVILRILDSGIEDVWVAVFISAAPPTPKKFGRRLPEEKNRSFTERLSPDNFFGGNALWFTRVPPLYSDCKRNIVCDSIEVLFLKKDSPCVVSLRVRHRVGDIHRSDAVREE